MLVVLSRYQILKNFSAPRKDNRKCSVCLKAKVWTFCLLSLAVRGITQTLSMHAFNVYLQVSLPYLLAPRSPLQFVFTLFLPLNTEILFNVEHPPQKLFVDASYAVFTR